LVAGQREPLLQPAVLRPRRLEPALVEHHPREREVGVVVAFEHRLEVDVDVRLGGQAVVITQEAQR
jgi:hypothetical protein